ncbi:transcription factor SPT20-like protein [Leptotrombidium deliense]|uniref:Transcription factor SPT20-like protein n=1 Tax=Leptotrombidium deliense TaxID=299467 RepID=A0A443SFR9_9ACAR|nr:transcription factor SPT20-like protein [Leptotrombidium deliense]
MNSHSNSFNSASNCDREKSDVCLVIKVYPNDDGFGVGLRRKSQNGKDESFVESMRLPFDENFLDYIENEELPPCLVDAIDSNADDDRYLDLFNCGALNIELRDYRRKSSKNNPSFETKFVRLKPTNLTLINDVRKLTSSFTINNRHWTQAEKITLEANLVLATSDRLCLDPDPNVAVVVNRLQFQKKWMKSSNKLQRLAKKFSYSHMNRIKKFQSLNGPKQLNLYEFLKQRSNHPSTASRLNKSTNNWREKKPQVAVLPPKSIDVEKIAKVISPPPITKENALLKTEEFIMEFMDPEKKTLYTVTMYHRPVDDKHFGQLSVNRSRENQSSNGSSCLFQFASKQLTRKFVFIEETTISVLKNGFFRRYIEQFIDILSENGRKSVKITHQVVGAQPKVSYSLATNVSNVKELEKNMQQQQSQTTVKKQFTPSVVTINAPIQHTFKAPSVNQQMISLSKVGSLNEACQIIPSSTTASVAHRPNTVTSLTKVPSLPIHTSSITKPETAALAVILTAHPLANPNTSSVHGQKMNSETLPETIVTSTIQHSSVPVTAVTTTTTLPSGINLANLNLASVQNLRLHNLVSLTNVQGVPQGIALPISLAMMPTTATTASGTSVPIHSQPTTAFMTSSGNMIVGIETPVLQSQLIAKPSDR